MDQLLLLAHQFTQYEYITFSILATILPILMHIGVIVLPSEFKYKQVFRSYLITLSALIFVVTYIILSIFFKIGYDINTTLIFSITIITLIMEFLYFQYNRVTILFVILIPFLLSPMLLTNLFNWSHIVLFSIPFVITSLIFFFVFRKDGK